MLNVVKIKSDFPIFKNDPSLVYLDSTATSLKPKIVIEKEQEYYEKYSANIYRGLYKISEKATEEYEETRQDVAKFIGAKRGEEIIFTRGTTESLNLLAYSLGREIVERNDEIVTTIMEHHSNFVPWQQVAIENGATLKIVDVDEEGRLQPIHNSEFRIQNIISKRTKILTITHVSNVLGTINPLKTIIAEAKRINPKIIVIVDAAQAVPHMKVDVGELDCDFMAFSAHKMLGPTGVGVLYGKYELLASMFPFQYGGEMIEEVYLDRTLFKKPPHKFEAGTPNIAGVIAFKAAIEYLGSLDWLDIESHEKNLAKETIQRLDERFGKKIRIIGPNLKGENKSGIVAFKFDNIHPHDVSQILDEDNVAVRAGNHCAMPLHTRYNLDATTRASFYIYNSLEDVIKLIKGLEKVEKLLG